MNEILYQICRNDLFLMDWHPYPSTLISKRVGMSLCKTRKELKKLKEQGLIKSVIYSEVDEEQNYIFRGYESTEKAKSTEEYKKAYLEEEKSRKEIWGTGMAKDEMYG